MITEANKMAFGSHAADALVAGESGPSSRPVGGFQWGIAGMAAAATVAAAAAHVITVITSLLLRRSGRGHGRRRVADGRVFP